MKTLILVRHAKSSWEDAGTNDIDRPLNERGKKDAPEMAERLKDKDLKIDVILSSPAKRAHKTAKYFAEELDFGKKEILLLDKLYEASVEAFFEAVEQLKDKYEAALIVSHNPGITDFINMLTNVHVDDMPTCGVFALQAATETWADFKTSTKDFLFFDYPKNPLG